LRTDAAALDGNADEHEASLCNQKQAPGCGHERDRIADGAVTSGTRPRTVGLHPEQESDQARSGLRFDPLAPLAGGSNPLAEQAYRRLDRHFASPGGAAFSMPRLPIGRPCNVVSLLAYCRFRRVKQGTHEPAA